MDILIIGGGVSGVLAAIEASKNKSNNVIIIEKNNKLMKKLLITGNGSCNFTNDSFFGFEHETNLIYNNTFFRNIYKKFDNKKLIEYLKNIGILSTYKEHFGQKYYYPYDRKATSIYYNLYDKLVDNNVDLHLEEEVNDIKIINNKYIITTDKSKYNIDKLVVTAGGSSYPNTGSDGKIFDILKDIGIKIIDPIPSLTPLIFKDDKLSILKGIRLEAEVKGYVDNKNLFSDYGEIQFNDNNISGIPILNASMKLARSIKNKNNVYISIDMLPDIDGSEFIHERVKLVSHKFAKDLMCGIIDNKIYEYILDKLNIKFNNNIKVSDINHEDLHKIVDMMKDFRIEIIDLCDFNKSQVTKGGVAVDNIDDTNYESKLYKNLYFAGEVIDVDGICGGYNLTFAMISGINVGINLAK